MITYPQIDPILVHIGPLAIRWYSLAYLAGVIFGAWYIKTINNKFSVLDKLNPFDDLLFYSVIGIIIGGRIGYTIFYHPEYYLYNLSEIFKIWHGGMSFHGGLIGLTLSLLIFSYKNNYSFLSLTDLCATSAPIGLFFGRLANFVNGELYGRITDVPWGMVFPNGGPLPRHPSQLYEAVLEGIITFFVLMYFALRKNTFLYKGTLSGLFLLCYSLSRIIIENFRQPDEHLGFIFSHITMGQILSIPMLLLGVFLIFLSRIKNK